MLNMLDLKLQKIQKKRNEMICIDKYSQNLIEIYEKSNKE